jgi:hypothetical protein
VDGGAVDDGVVVDVVAMALVQHPPAATVKVGFGDDTWAGRRSRNSSGFLHAVSK